MTNRREPEINETPSERFQRFRERQAHPELAVFADAHAFPLDDFQMEACRHVEDGSGVLVAAPTGAGKTIVGEFAVHLAMQQGRKAFYTTPIKALSNQKYQDLCRVHGAANVGLLTGDSSVNSEAQIVVMTTEVLRNMIYASSPTLNNLGYVVMDEVHYLADRFRGAVWEEVIIGLAESVQMICLSATVSNAEEFGEWLAEVRGEVAVVVAERRPVPLYQHVLVGHRLHDLFAGVAPTAVTDDTTPTRRVEVNPALQRVAKDESRRVRDDSRRPRGRSGRGKKRAGYGSGSYGGAAHRRHQEGSRSLVPSRSQTVAVLAERNLLPAIVFIFSRSGCDAAVRQLQQDRVRLTSPEEELDILTIAERHVAGFSPADLAALDWERFLDGLLRGVAAHHAGLLPAFKECVEECFVAGLVKVVFATETLALGINMPARSVVIERLVKYNGETHADITPGEYTQLTGRAGRRGIDTEGHAVVAWQPGLDPRAVAGLASTRTYPLRSSFAPTYNMAVNMVARVGRAPARTLLEQSFAQFQTDRSVVGLARTIARNEATIAEQWARSACDRGDFSEYARMRDEISTLETTAARARRSDRRAESQEALAELRTGDIIRVPHGRNTGWALVVDPGVGDDVQGPRPQVMTAAHHVRRLALSDFPTPPVVVGRMRVPRRFNPKEAASRRSLAAAFDSTLARLNPDVPRAGRRPADPAAAEQIAELRVALQHHPCHGCPDRELHARAAERALRLERENTDLQRRVSRRTSTIAQHFDRICAVLQSLGYLVEGDDENDLVVTDDGRMLSRIYNELDLVAAEAVRDHVFDGLDPAQLAATLSSLVFESRRDTPGHPRMPDAQTAAAVEELRRVRRRIADVERDHRMPRARDLDTGFVEAVYAWVQGRPLSTVLGQSRMTAGDFVRWVRQVIDFTGQIADAAGPGDLRRTARIAVDAMRRGVVDAAPDED